MHGRGRGGAGRGNFGRHARESGAGATAGRVGTVSVKSFALSLAHN